MRSSGALGCAACEGGLYWALLPVLAIACVLLAHWLRGRAGDPPSRSDHPPTPRSDDEPLAWRHAGRCGKDPDVDD